MFSFPIPNLFGLKTLAIGVALAFLVGSFSGWKVRDAFCDAAQAKAQVVVLTKQIEANEAAAKGDLPKLEAAQKEIEELKRKAQDAESRTSTGECLSPDDADRVRHFWHK